MEMHTRNSTSSGSRNVISIDAVGTAHIQENNPSTQATIVPMHPHHYLNYPSHPQMMGMPQMPHASHGIENHFQVVAFCNFCLK